MMTRKPCEQPKRGLLFTGALRSLDMQHPRGGCQEMSRAPGCSTPTPIRTKEAQQRVLRTPESRIHNDYEQGTCHAASSPWARCSGREQENKFKEKKTTKHSDGHRSTAASTTTKGRRCNMPETSATRSPPKKVRKSDTSRASWHRRVPHDHDGRTCEDDGTKN